MTEREAAIITAYTGIMIGSFSTFHKYAEEKLCRPIFTHEFMSKKFLKTVKVVSSEDFKELNKNIIEG